MQKLLCSEIKSNLVASEKIKVFKTCCWNTAFFCLFSFKNYKLADNSEVELTADEAYFSNFIEKVLKHSGVSYQKKEVLSANNKYLYKFSINSSFLVKNVDQLNTEPLNRCCKHTFLSISFICSGYLSNPAKNYHLEFDSYSLENIKILQKLLVEEEIEAKYYEKNKDFFVLYIKKSDDIIRFLGLIGAHKTLLEIENVRIEKDIKNKIIRQINYETSNLQKTIESSVKYASAIEWYMNQGLFSELPENLQEIAILRLKYPDKNLRELCELTTEPITKSGINHRLRKLFQIIDKEKRIRGK